MNTYHDCSAELKQADLSVTPARIAAMKEFEKHDQSIDAQHLLDDLQKKLNIDRVTVFRILNSFVEHGLIRKLEFGEGKARYELASKDHFHIVCPSCGKISDEKEDSALHLFLEQRAKKYGSSYHELKFITLCKDCQRKEKN